MKKHVLPILALFTLAAVLLVIAACGPVPTASLRRPQPLRLPRATPVAPATQAVEITVAAPVSGTVPAPVEGQRPLAAITPAARNDRFSGPAAKYVQDDTVYLATIVTDKGNIVAELYQDTPEA